MAKVCCYTYAMAQNKSVYSLCEDSVTREKARVRKCALMRRDALLTEDRTMRSKILCDRVVELLSSQLAQGSLLAVYASLGSEVDTMPLLREAYRRKWCVCLPCMLDVSAAFADISLPRMAFLEVKQEIFDAHEAPFLVKPACAVLPDDPLLAYASFVEPNQFDAVVVPLVAFDMNNNRLGYGGGNYDRFLAQVRDDALVVGMAFAEQCVDAVPLEAHDKPLPRIEIA